MVVVEAEVVVLVVKAGVLVVEVVVVVVAGVECRSAPPAQWRVARLFGSLCQSKRCMTSGVPAETSRRGDQGETRVRHTPTPQNLNTEHTPLSTVDMLGQFEEGCV